MNVSHSSKKCTFCHQIKIFDSLTNTWQCPNRKCRSHQFVIGNRVQHIFRPDLGLGIIREIHHYSSPHNQYSKSGWAKGKYVHESKLTNKKTRPSNSDHCRYVVEFDTFLEDSLFPANLNHYLWLLGQKVKVDDTVGTITHQNLHHSSGLIFYEILTSQGKTRIIDETQITKTLEDPVQEFLKGELSHPYRFLLHYWSHQFNDLYSSNHLKIITNSRLTLLPHQIAVAHHLLEQGFARYILADEVGLGKTIEAGIYIKEMIARNLVQRVLIITPASITGQWEFELENKFNLNFTRLTSKILKKTSVNYQTGNLHYKKQHRELTLCTATLQFARMEFCSDIITKIEWDIVVFDEAHHLRRYLENRKTERYRTTLAYDLAEILAKKTKSLLLLSATPIQLHSFDLFSLIQLINPYEFPNFDSFETMRRKMRLLNLVVKNLHRFTRLNTYERNALVPQIQSFDVPYSEQELNQKLKFKEWRKQLIRILERQHFLSRYVIRNRRRRVFPKHDIHRIPQVVEVELTKPEYEVYNKIHLYLAKIYSENFVSEPSGMGFVMVILQKLLTSSVPAVLKSLKKRIAYLKENKDMILKLGMESEIEREFTADESSLDVMQGLEEYDLEDRLVIHKRKRKMKAKKKQKKLNIDQHIKILEEFVEDLQSLSHDSKATKLLNLIDQILQADIHEKLIIFTQFKQTLFYLKKLIQSRGYEVAEFHGDLTEHQKSNSVRNFRKSTPILLSTEIGGEGRNFQFCHIIVNYDLPWNPMRLEQRIGRLDRIGQTKNVFIYNFYIKDTVESSILVAITERIHLFEESIGSLEPILGDLESNITDLVLKEEQVPIKFRLEEVIEKTGRKIEKVYDQLEDFILDKHSFQYDYLGQDLDNPHLISALDLLSFFKLIDKFFKIPHSNALDQFSFNFNLIKKPDERGIWRLKLNEPLRKKILVSHRVYEGILDLDLAQKQEEYDFFALGHPLVMNASEWFKNDEFGGFTTVLPLKRTKWAQLFIDPYVCRLQEKEIPIFKRILNHELGLNLFLFEIQFAGIIHEKMVVPVFITDEMNLIKTLNNSVLRPHQLFELVAFNELHDIMQTFKEESFLSYFHITRELLEEAFYNAQQSTKIWIRNRAQQLIRDNKSRYHRERKKAIDMAKFKKKYAKSQLETAKLNFRAKKLKLPTERQKKNVEKITNPQKKARRLQDFKKRQRDVEYYETEIKRWEKILEDLEFDIPARLKRLKKYKQLYIDANLLGYARILII